MGNVTQHKTKTITKTKYDIKVWDRPRNKPVSHGPLRGAEVEKLKFFLLRLCETQSEPRGIWTKQWASRKACHQAGSRCLTLRTLTPYANHMATNKTNTKPRLLWKVEHLILKRNREGDWTEQSRPVNRTKAERLTCKKGRKGGLRSLTTQNQLSKCSVERSARAGKGDQAGVEMGKTNTLCLFGRTEPPKGEGNSCPNRVLSVDRLAKARKGNQIPTHVSKMGKISIGITRTREVLLAERLAMTRKGDHRDGATRTPLRTTRTALAENKLDKCLNTGPELNIILEHHSETKNKLAELNRSEHTNTAFSSLMLFTTPYCYYYYYTSELNRNLEHAKKFERAPYPRRVEHTLKKINIELIIKQSTTRSFRDLNPTEQRTIYIRTAYVGKNKLIETSCARQYYTNKNTCSYICTCFLSSGYMNETDWQGSWLAANHSLRSCVKRSYTVQKNCKLRTEAAANTAMPSKREHIAKKCKLPLKLLQVDRKTGIWEIPSKKAATAALNQRATAIKQHALQTIAPCVVSEKRFSSLWEKHNNTIIAPWCTDRNMNTTLYLTLSGLTSKMSKPNPLDNGTQANCTTYSWNDKKIKWALRPKFSTHVVPEDLTEDPRLQRPTGKNLPKKKLRDFPIETIIPHNRKNCDTVFDPRKTADAPVITPTNMRISRHEQMQRRHQLGNPPRPPSTSTTRSDPRKRHKAIISLPNSSKDRIAKKPKETLTTVNNTPETITNAREPNRANITLKPCKSNSTTSKTTPKKQLLPLTSGLQLSSSSSSSSNSSSSSSTTDSDSSSSGNQSPKVDPKSRNTIETSLKAIFGSDYESDQEPSANNAQPNIDTTIANKAANEITEPVEDLALAEILNELTNTDSLGYDTCPSISMLEATLACEQTPIDLAALVADLGSPTQFLHGLDSDTKTASESETTEVRINPPNNSNGEKSTTSCAYDPNTAENQVTTAPATERAQPTLHPLQQTLPTTLTTTPITTITTKAPTTSREPQPATPPHHQQQ